MPPSAAPWLSVIVRGSCLAGLLASSDCRATREDARAASPSPERRDASSTPSPSRRFWSWFSANDDRLFDFERDQKAVFDELAAQLVRVHPDLTFELGPVRDGRRDFVVSAGGIKAA